MKGLSNIWATTETGAAQTDRRTTEGEHLCSPHRSRLYFQKKNISKCHGKGNFVIRKKVLIGKTASPLSRSSTERRRGMFFYFYYYHPMCVLRYFLSCCRGGGSLYYTSMGWLFKNRIYISTCSMLPMTIALETLGKKSIYVDSSIWNVFLYAQIIFSGTVNPPSLI